MIYDLEIQNRIPTSSNPSLSLSCTVNTFTSFVADVEIELSSKACNMGRLIILVNIALFCTFIGINTIGFF